MIQQVTIEEARKIIEDVTGQSLFIPGLPTQITTEKYDVMCCDYRALAAYKVAYACEIWDVEAQKQVRRFNVMR